MHGNFVPKWWKDNFRLSRRTFEYIVRVGDPDLAYFSPCKQSLFSKKAIKEGITTALGIPTWIYEEDGYVMTFLSAKGTPIARRFEIWTPYSKKRVLKFNDGYSHGDMDLAKLYKDVELSKDNSILGQTWKTGMPNLSKIKGMPYVPGDCENILSLPILENGFCKAIIAFYY